MIASSTSSVNLYLAAGSTTTYVLPAPPGYWAPATKCEVWREACGQSDSACRAGAESCKMDRTTNVNNCNLTTTSGSCPLTTFNQPCDWQNNPALLGETVYVLPLGSNDLEYPFACAPGVLGGSGSSEQTSAACAGFCPAGFTCGTEATTEPVSCTQGHFCPAGVSAALPCKVGSYSNATILTSAEECMPTAKGFFAPTGSTQQTKCSPGTVAPEASMGACSRCAAGSFQGAEGSQTCNPCPVSSWCAAGSSAATACTAGTVGRLPNLTSDEECEPCPAGSWCSAGIAIPCPQDSYNSLINKTNQGACTACPENAVANKSSSSFDDCRCEVDFYLDNATECKPCPLPGTSCNAVGTTLETLPLAHGFWRPSNESVDVRPCPDEGGGNASGCGGGVALCKTNRDLTGVYCRTCTNASTYYVSSKCRPCDSLVGSWITAGLGVVLGALALVLVGVGLWSRRNVRKRLRALQQRTLGMLWRAVRRFSLKSKIKVAWSFYQIVGNMGAVYHLTIPENVAPLLDTIEIGISVGFDGLGSLLGCAGLSSEVSTLTFYIVAPMLVVLVTSAAILLRAAARRRGEQSWVRQALLAMLRPALLVSFCTYPIVASAAFQAFACEPLGDVKLRYLPPDYSLECGPEGEPTDEYKSLAGVAIVAIVIYPVGISLTTALLLYIARVPLRAGHSTDFTQAISFLP